MTHSKTPPAPQRRQTQWPAAHGKAMQLNISKQPTLFHVKTVCDWAPDWPEWSEEGYMKFAAGEVIAVTSVEMDGWWTGIPLSDTAESGWREARVFPNNFTQQLSVWSDGTINPDGIIFYVQALYDALPSNEEELRFAAGDIIGITNAPSDGWWHGTPHNSPQVGGSQLPANFVEGVEPPWILEDQRVGDCTAVLFRVIALFDRKGDDMLPEDLEMEQGDVIEIYEAPGDGWWVGAHTDPTKRKVQGRKQVPRNFVDIF